MLFHTLHTSDFGHHLFFKCFYFKGGHYSGWCVGYGWGGGPGLGFGGWGKDQLGSVINKNCHSKYLTSDLNLIDS